MFTKTSILMYAILLGIKYVWLTSQKLVKLYVPWNIVRFTVMFGTLFFNNMVLIEQKIKFSCSFLKYLKWKLVESVTESYREASYWMLSFNKYIIKAYDWLKENSCAIFSNIRNIQANLLSNHFNKFDSVYNCCSMQKCFVLFQKIYITIIHFKYIQLMNY